MSNLPIKPMLSEAEIDRESRIRDLYTGVAYPYEGEIKPGMIFAWEPDLPHARELAIVSRIAPPPPPETIQHSRGTAVINTSSDENVIWTYDFPKRSREVWNDESRFREAVYATILNP